jgi:hypothetical protein
MPVLTLFVWALLLAGIPALVRTVDGRLCGDRLGKLAAAAVSALALFAALLGLAAGGSPLPPLAPVSFGANGDGVSALALLCLAYWIALYVAWVAAAHVKQLRRRIDSATFARARRWKALRPAAEPDEQTGELPP